MTKEQLLSFLAALEKSQPVVYTSIKPFISYVEALQNAVLSTKQINGLVDIIKKMPDLKDTFLPVANLLLHAAIRDSNIENVKLALSIGANIHSFGQYGHTALTELVCGEEKKETAPLAKFLIEQKAEIDLQDKTEFGNTPLLAAIAFHRKELTLTLLKYAEKASKAINDSDRQPDCKNTPLILAIKQGWTDVALQLIEKNAQVDHLSADNFTPLHYAALLRQDDVIKALLKQGANPKQKNKHGVVPLDYYLCEFAEIDTLGGYRTREDGSLMLFSNQPIIIMGRLADIRHAIYHQGFNCNNRGIPSQDITVTLGGSDSQKHPSTEFMTRVNETRRKKLGLELECIRLLGAKFPFQKTIQTEFDAVLSKTLFDLEPYPYKQEERLKEAFKQAKQIFIDTYIENINKPLDAKTEFKVTRSP